MSHLTDEQFEAILAGTPDPSGHLEACEECCARLQEKQALAARLRQTYSSVKASEDLINRIRTVVATATASVPKKPNAVKAHFIVLHRRLFSTLAAAAALLIFVVPGVLYFGVNSRVEASQMELARIHQYNLSSGDNFIHCDDPNTLENHFHEHLGHNPAEEGIGAGLPLHGCCVHDYKGRQVGTYVVKSREGLVTIVTLTERPRSLGMRRMDELSQPDCVIWGAICNHCNMAARRVGNKTYYAMGQVSHTVLAEVLAGS